MLRDRDTVRALRGAIGFWRSDAEDEISRAERSKREAEEFSAAFERAVEELETVRCPFCEGETVDFGSLRGMADELQNRRVYLYQGEHLEPTCMNCGSYETNPPKCSARRWLSEQIEPKSKVFAAEVFHDLHRVDEVAIEQAAGKGWMFRVGETWYANRAPKEELKRLWGM